MAWKGNKNGTCSGGNVLWIKSKEKKNNNNKRKINKNTLNE